MKAEGEKCNTSLSQAIPVPNSSLSIIWWFIINRLPLQFWSRNFLWINVGLFFFPFLPPQSHCLKPSRVTVSAPANIGCLTSGGLFWGYSWKSHSEVVIICLSPSRLCWEYSFQEWSAAVFVFSPRVPVYYLCTGAFFRPHCKHSWSLYILCILFLNMNEVRQPCRRHPDQGLK